MLLAITLPVDASSAKTLAPKMGPESRVKLTGSPAFAGLIVWPGELVSKNCTFEMLDQRRSARCAAPMTSLPTLMFSGGEASEVESEMMIGCVSQRRATTPDASR